MFTYQFHINIGIDRIQVICDLTNVEFNLRYSIAKQFLPSSLKHALLMSEPENFISNLICDLVKEGMLNTMGIFKTSQLTSYQRKIYIHVISQPISKLIEDKQSLINFEECKHQLIKLIS